MQPDTLGLILVCDGEVDANRIFLHAATISFIDRRGRPVVRTMYRHSHPGVANARWLQNR